MLNSDHVEPLYIQLKKTIQSSIANGEFEQGEKIPTEVELSEKYKISRVTVRKAILELVEEGYLVKKQGKGTFVKIPKIERKIQHVMGFTAACMANGLTSHSIVANRELFIPDKTIQTALQLEEGEKVIYIQRIRYAGDFPLMLENNYYSYERFKFLLEESLEGSLYELLRKKYHINPDLPGETTLEIAMADDKIAKLLDTSIGKALFFMNTTIYDSMNSLPVHVGKQYIIGDRYIFTL